MSHRMNGSGKCLENLDKYLLQKFLSGDHDIICCLLSVLDGCLLSLKAQYNKKKIIYILVYIYKIQNEHFFMFFVNFFLIFSSFKVEYWDFLSECSFVEFWFIVDITVFWSCFVRWWLCYMSYSNNLTIKFQSITL